MISTPTDYKNNKESIIKDIIDRKRLFLITECMEF